jgi:hypothetical protein
MTRRGAGKARQPVSVDGHQTVERYAIQDFATEQGALAAIRALTDAGFAADGISVMARDDAVARDITAQSGPETEAGESVVTGVTAGGVIGAAGALLLGATTLAVPGLGLAVGGPLVGALAGAAGGGLLAGLIGLGIPDDEAELYAERVDAGRILLVVSAGERVEQAREIMLGIVDAENAEAGIYADSGDSTGNTILDQGIISHTMGITPPVDADFRDAADEGYTPVGDEGDEEV